MSATARDEVEQAMREVLLNNFKRHDFHDIIVTVGQRHIDEGDMEKFNMQRTLVAEYRPDDLAEFDRVFADHIS